MGGLSPPCLTHAVLALTAQNNIITLDYFLSFSQQHPVMLLLGIFSMLHYLPQVPLCSIAAACLISPAREVSMPPWLQPSQGHGAPATVNEARVSSGVTQPTSPGCDGGLPAQLNQSGQIV